MSFAQGTAPKPKPEDYEAHAQAGEIGIGAEFMVHSVSGEGLTFIAKDYLVVEVALFPSGAEGGEKKAWGEGNKLDIRYGAFGLRINGKKQVELPQAAYMVASLLQHPDWAPADHMWKRVEASAMPG